MDNVLLNFENIEKLLKNLEAYSNKLFATRLFKKRLYSSEQHCIQILIPNTSRFNSGLISIIAGH